MQRFAFFFGVWLLVEGAVASPYSQNGDTNGNVAFDNVQGIFEDQCVRCHQSPTPPAGLLLVLGQSYRNIVNVASTEYPAWQRVQPGNRAVSWLYEKISNPTPRVGSQMGKLSADEIELIGRWIDQGASAIPFPPYAALEFRTTALPNSEIDIAYNTRIVVWGGLPPYQFSLVEGSLPPGMALHSASGQISGTPAAAGPYEFTIRVDDHQAPPERLEKRYRLEVSDAQSHWQFPPDFELQPVVTDLNLPVNIAFVPNPGPSPESPYFYVTLLYGEIVMVQRNFQKQVYATNLLNFDPTGNFPGSGEIGVTGITVDPASGDVFATMVYDENDTKYGKVVRFSSHDGGRTAATQTTIFSGVRASASHQIQAVTIGPDGKLYVNVGDGGAPEAAPDLNDLRGKILRMNLDGSLPADNPFPNSYVYASGLRNPFGAAWRPEDGHLYISDNGPEVEDRLIKVTAGNDYGWALVDPDLTKGAIFLWTPTVAPVAIDFLRATPFPTNYHGQLFVGWSGPAYHQGPAEYGKKIQAFQLDANGQVVSESIFLDYIGAGSASVIGLAFGPDGLYFTDLYGENGFDNDGRTHGNVYRIRWRSDDQQPPVISNVHVAALTDNSATIVWQTHEPATRQVEFGTTTAYGNWTAYAADLATTHRVVLSRLRPQATYHFRVWNWDAAQNGAVSDDFTFTTAASSITHEEVQTGGATNAVAVATAAALAGVEGHLYLAAISSQPRVAVNAVSGLGMSWSRLLSQCSGRNHTAVEIWMAQGTPSRNDTVIAMFEGLVEHAVIAVSRYAGASTKHPIGNAIAANTNGPAGPCLNGSVSNAYTVDFTTTANGAIIYSAVAKRHRTHSPGLGYTERAEAQQGTFDSMAGIAIQDRVVPTISTVRVEGTFNSTVDWAMAAVEMWPQGQDTVDDVVQGGNTLAPALPVAYNYPNPFSAETAIVYTLPQPANVRLVIYNVAGQVVRRLIDDIQPAGQRRVTWDGTNDSGERARSGVYFYRLESATQRVNGKIVFLP
ncbi:MAG: PQQ-dependent sugar dehydrogenase [candidate division KSB1 bacterium]|nr:PQQ-dependent sugar dehydrogenase [candidate division KSB1 bacterium]